MTLEGSIYTSKNQADTSSHWKSQKVPHQPPRTSWRTLIPGHKVRVNIKKIIIKKNLKKLNSINNLSKRACGAAESAEVERV